MATTKEPADGLVDLGRHLADDAAQLVRAELSLAKAQVLELVLRFALGAGLLIGAGLFACFCLIFTIGTLVEGVNALDSWPLYASLGGLVLAAVVMVIGGHAPRWLSWLVTILTIVSLITFAVGIIWFYVAAIIGGNGEVGRRGWAIAATALFTITALLGGIGGLTVWRGVRGAQGSIEEFKEDATWVKQLTKRATNEN